MPLENRPKFGRRIAGCVWTIWVALAVRLLFCLSEMEDVASVVFAGAVGLVFAEALKSSACNSRESPAPDYDDYENVLTEHHSVTHRGFALNENPVDRILSWISFRLRTSSFNPFRISSGRGFRRACRRMTADIWRRASLGLCRNKAKNQRSLSFDGYGSPIWQNNSDVK